MARNATLPLSADQHRAADVARAMLTPGQAVRVAYVKRDGTPRILSGEVSEFVGAYGTTTDSVVIDTEDGPRTANLYRVVSVTPL